MTYRIYVDLNEKDRFCTNSLSIEDVPVIGKYGSIFSLEVIMDLRGVED
jgi:hypothetical protein